MTRPLRVALVLAGVMALAWLSGFAWFVQGATQPRMAPGSAGHADGIVVLTGGADRIATGMRLLSEGRGRVLLISGVGHGVELTSLLRGIGIDAPSAPETVTLGRMATSTAGNADETALWATAQGLHSLLVVTASYHMPRALTELQRSLPDVDLIPVPVRPPALRGRGGLPALGMLAHEYTKLIVSKLGLARLGGDPG